MVTLSPLTAAVRRFCFSVLAFFPFVFSCAGCATKITLTTFQVPNRMPMPEPPIFTTTKSVEVELERTDDGFKVNKVNKVVQQEYTPVTLSMLRDFERHGIDLTKIQFFLSSGITLLSEKKQTNYELTPAGNVKNAAS